MSRTLTITRPILGLPDLVITSNPFGADFWLPEEGLEEPDVTYRLTYMEDNPFIDGKQLLGAAREHSAIPLVIYTQATTAVGLRNNKLTLQAALGQFSYDVTLDVDGAADTYSADPCGPRWGEVDSGMVAQHIARCSVSIPVYPIPVA